MNEFQQNLYNDLMQLVNETDAFYFQDFNLDNNTYRIFNYRIASYTEFLRPSALECRGHMFNIVDNANPVLVSLPMAKFFNLNENPMVMNLDLSNVDKVEHKLDGSLISTFIHENELRLKSKGSLFSTQAVDAYLWLKQQAVLLEQMQYLVRCGYTINCEWISPTNRIVIGYPESSLRILNIRNNQNGNYFDKNDVPSVYDMVHQHWVDDVDINGMDIQQFVNSIPSMTGIEGFVLRFNNGMYVKQKTTAYLALHHTKDSINSDRRLYEAILNQTSDDLRSLFYDDEFAIARIEQMEQFVEVKYNSLVKTVDNFYTANKHLERKEYAILGQMQLSRLEFGLAMRKYLGQQVDYREFMISKWKEFGIKPDPVEVPNDEQQNII